MGAEPGSGPSHLRLSQELLKYRILGSALEDSNLRFQDTAFKKKTSKNPKVDSEAGPT